MTTERDPRRPRRWRPALCALLAPLLLAPAAIAAAPGEGELAPVLRTLSRPEVRSATPAAQAERLGLAARGAGSLLRDGDRVLVDVRFERGAASRVDELRDAGAEIVEASARYQTVTVAVRPADLTALGASPGVAGVSPVLTPLVLGADCGGLVRSEGDAQLNVPAARAAIGVDGSGVRVGILSDSFDRRIGAVTHAANDVASGDLPGPGSPCGSTNPIRVFDDSAGTTSDEGRAMAQIVHDLAPGADLDFATAFKGEGAFATSIRALAASGARVIVDDVVYLEEPFFQDGPVAVAVDDVAAAGVSYFSAAGNFNQISEGNDVASYEAPFRDAGECPGGVPGGQTACMDYDPDPGGEDVGYTSRVGAGDEYEAILQWAEPRGGVVTDLNAYLVTPGGTLLDASLEANVTTSQRPFEFISWKNTSGGAVDVRLAIVRTAGPPASPPRLKFIQIGDALTTPTQYAISSGDSIGPAIFGHAAASGAIGVAAVPFNTTAAPESFSSRGPVRHLYGPVLGAAPAPPTPEEVIAKPDLAATDGVRTTFFGSPSGGFFRFFGTSAAAPHAAAVAALALQANPGASPAAVRAALASTARPVGAFGPLAVGAGLIDAGAAVDALALGPAVTILRKPAARSRNRRPSIEFAANRPVTFACAVDGGAAQACSSPFRVQKALGNGRHRIEVIATDLSGRVGSAGTGGFRIDLKPPRTKVVKRPPKLVLAQRPPLLSFRFRSSEGGKRFRCKLDRNRTRPCGKRLVKRFGPGEHALRVRAVDKVGNVARKPAVVRFRVELAG